jgi:signal transduction histidine kinase
MYTHINLIQTFVVFLQLVGVFSLFLLCLLAQKGNQTRFRFDWLGFAILFFWIFILSQFLVGLNYTYLFVIYAYQTSLLLSSILFSIFLFHSTQGKSEKNSMGVVIIFFVVISVILFQFNSFIVFINLFAILFSMYCVFGFHILTRWSLRIQIEKRSLIILWGTSIKLFFLIFFGYNLLILFSSYLPLPLFTQILFYFHIFWFVVIYVMNESFWRLILWIRDIKKLPFDLLLKSIHLIVLLSFFILVTLFSSRINTTYLITTYCIFNLILMFFFFLMLHDRNPQKQDEQLLQDYRKFISLSPIPIGILNNYGALEWLNPAGLKMFDRDERDIFGIKFDDLVGKAEDIEWLKTVLKSTLHRKSMQILLDLSFSATSKKKSMKFVFYPIINEDDINNSRFVFSVLDETESRETLSIKDNLINLVSHHIRTPLTVISESVQLLKKYDKQPGMEETSQQIIEIANRNIKKMTELLDQILKMDNTSSGKFLYQFKLNNIHKLIRTLVTDFQMLDENKNLTFQLKLDSRKDEVVFDESSMTEVLSNLIMNAVKNTSSGTITVGTFGSKNEISIYVQDTGSGISEDVLPKIFEPFSPGLGLSICKTIVLAHGGQIFAESKWGKGSRFTISLPG